MIYYRKLHFIREKVFQEANSNHKHMTGKSIYNPIIIQMHTSIRVTVGAFTLRLF